MPPRDPQQDIRTTRVRIEARMVADTRKEDCMGEYIEKEIVPLFREEWQAAQGDSFAAELHRRSLAASAQGHPELEAIMAANVKCPFCNGNGWVWAKSKGEVTDLDCDVCEGNGKVTEHVAAEF